MSESPSVEWIGVPSRSGRTVVQRWNGLATITLAKMSTGARLTWIFHDHKDDQLGLFVHLTDDEAQAVYDTAPGVGPIEQIRATLQDPHAYAWRLWEGRFSSVPFEIPRHVDEQDFATQAWAAATRGMPVDETAV